MDKKVYLFLADGFEEIEGLTVADLLRRAGIFVQTVSITGESEVHGAHGINVLADSLFEKCDFSDGVMFVLPGGMPGTTHLAAHQGLGELLQSGYGEGRRIAAICAAPTVLSALGILADHEATCYPSRMPELKCRERSEASVVTDRNITTSRGLGTAIDFSLELITLLVSEEKAQEIAESIVYR